MEGNQNLIIKFQIIEIKAIVKYEIMRVQSISIDIFFNIIIRTIKNINWIKKKKKTEFCRNIRYALGYEFFLNM